MHGDDDSVGVDGWCVWCTWYMHYLLSAMNGSSAAFSSILIHPIHMCIRDVRRSYIIGSEKNTCTDYRELHASMDYVLHLNAPAGMLASDVFVLASC